MPASSLSVGRTFRPRALSRRFFANTASSSRTRPPHVPLSASSEIGRTNLWQMDFKGHFPTASGRCHSLTVLDDHFRYCVGLHACTDERGETVEAQVTTIFRCFGMPGRILCDNAHPGGQPGAETRWTGLTIWLLKLGIRVSHGRAFHPQPKAKTIALHRPLDVEVIQRQTWPDVAACQRRFDPWRQV